MFPEPFEKEMKGVRVNISHLSAEGIVRLCEIFHARHFVEKSNGFVLLVISRVTYDEFVTIVSIYGNYNTTGKMHFVLKPAPHVDVHITSEIK